MGVTKPVSGAQSRSCEASFSDGGGHKNIYSTMLFINRYQDPFFSQKRGKIASFKETSLLFLAAAA